MPLSFEIVPADRLEPAVLHAAMTAAFADYLIGPFTATLDAWPQFLGRQAIDLSVSRAAMKDGELAAFAFVAQREDIAWWRLSTMGSPPAHRGSGAARSLLDDFIERARGAGREGVELECFAQNERALKLYRSRGFEAVSELRGYVREPGAAAATHDDGVMPIEIDDAFAHIDRIARSRGDLPVQVTPQSLRASAVPLRALRRGGAVVVFSEPGAATLTVNAIVDPAPSLVDAQALAAHLAAKFPQHRITAGQLQRPDIGGDALERAGFARQPLYQLLMRKPF